jgi:LysM repeat protein
MSIGRKEIAIYTWDDFTQDATKVSKETGYPLAVLLGQAAQETGRNVSNAPGNNFFGIKGSGNGGKQLLQTWEDYGGGRTPTQDYFAKFSSPEDAIKAYVDTITNLVPNWKDIKDPASLLTAIKAAGYATDPSYVQNVMNTPEFKKYADTSNSSPLNSSTIIPKMLDYFHLGNGLVPQAQAAEKNYSSYPMNYQQTQAPLYSVKSGDTLWGIAQKYLGNGSLYSQLGYQGNPNTLQVGTQLRIPTTVTTTTVNKPNTSTANGAVYTSPPGSPNTSTAQGAVYTPPNSSVPGSLANYSSATTGQPAYAPPPAVASLPLSFSLSPTANSSAMLR